MQTLQQNKNFYDYYEPFAALLCLIYWLLNNEEIKFVLLVVFLMKIRRLFSDSPHKY